MKTSTICTELLVALLAVAVTRSAPALDGIRTGANYTVITDTLDTGGQHVTGANYAADGSLGGIGGVSNASADTNKNGYIGQLYEVVSVVVTAAPSSLSDTSTAQLSGEATLDDNSVLALSGSDVDWSSPNIPYPILSINGGGLLSPASVYANTPGVVDGYYLGAANSTALFVFTPDTVADGIPDWWRAAYFGGSGTTSNNQSCATCDPDGTGQDNLFKYIAGLNPTNPVSVFVLKIAPVAGQPGQKNLIYSPIMEGPAADQIYTVQFRTNLVSGAYATVPTISVLQTNGTAVTATDTNATEVGEYYRVQITLPGDP
jgi:hypothetical protein